MNYNSNTTADIINIIKQASVNVPVLDITSIYDPNNTIDYHITNNQIYWRGLTLPLFNLYFEYAYKFCIGDITDIEIAIFSTLQNIVLSHQ